MQWSRGSTLTTGILVAVLSGTAGSTVTWTGTLTTSAGLAGSISIGRLHRSRYSTHQLSYSGHFRCDGAACYRRGGNFDFLTTGDPEVLYPDGMSFGRHGRFLQCSLTLPVTLTPCTARTSYICFGRDPAPRPPRASGTLELVRLSPPCGSN